MFLLEKITGSLTWLDLLVILVPSLLVASGAVIMRRNDADDGTVRDHRNAGEEAIAPAAETQKAKTAESVAAVGSTEAKS